jgi:hypothetical protein
LNIFCTARPREAHRVKVPHFTLHLARPIKALHARCPIKIRFVLTDNGKEFADGLFGLRKRDESGTP